MGFLHGVTVCLPRGVTRRVRDDVIAQLVDRHRPIVTNVNLCGSIHVTAISCARLGDCCNLQDLNLAGCVGVTDGGVHDVLQGCPSLLALNLARCSITDVALLYLGTYATALESLSLAYCGGMTDAGALSLAGGAGCKDLHHLDLSGCVNVSGEGLVNVVGTCGANLRTLVLNDLPALPNVVLFAVATSCPHLRSVSLHHCARISDKGLQMLQQCTELRRLYLTTNHSVTGDALRCVARGAPHLHDVQLVDCARAATGGFPTLGACPLTTLTLTHSAQMSDIQLRCVCNGIRHTQVCTLSHVNTT